jgi:hypothetical protein
MLALFGDHAGVIFVTRWAIAPGGITARIIIMLRAHKLLLIVAIFLTVSFF